MSLTDDFKETLAAWASGVTVVATKAEGLIYGITVSSFTSLSLEPPLILVCLANSSRVVPMIESAGGFTVSLLAAGQDDVSNYFAQPGRDPTADFENVPGAWTESGMPIIGNALAHLECSLHSHPTVGDHTIAIGQVVHTHAAADRLPLLYQRRAYRTLANHAPSVA